MRLSTLSTVLLAAGVALCNTLGAQNVGVGIATPAAKLEVDGGFAVTPVAVPAGAAITVPVNETVIRITNDGANVAIGVAAPASATEGQFLSIRNEDATNTATFAGTAIPAGQIAEFIFLNGGWRFRAGTATTDWGLTGNTGTVAGTNYIGTNDAQAFDIRTNGLLRARFNTGGGIYLQNPTGAGNTVIGNTNAAVTPPTGTENTVMGAFAGNSLTTGVNNTALGNQAMATNSVGNFNTVVGRAALFSATGSDNTAMGHLALLFTTSGSANTAVGAGIMQTNTTGSGNAGFGFFALSGNTTGNNNAAIGNGAGSVNSTGSNNTFLGSGANASANNLTNATAVGNGAVVGSSNSLVLGNNAVNVGIGSVTAPTARLHINGAYANTFTALAAGAAPAIANNVTHVRLTDDGAAAANAITGPAAPVDGQVLTIVNNDAQAATFAGTSIAASTGAASFVYANGAWRVYGNSLGDNLGNHIATTQIQSTLGSAAAPGYSFIGDLNTGVFAPAADQMAISTAGTERVRVSATGTVGIGTTTPNGTLQFGNALNNRTIVLYENVNNANEFFGFGINNSTLRMQIPVADANHRFAFFAATSAAASNELMRIDGTGNVGIGTAAPGTRLDVSGNARVQFNATTMATNNPALEIYSPDLGDPTLISRIRFHQGNQYWASMGYHTLGVTNGPGEFVFWSHNTGVEARVRAGDGYFTGSVGIGTATPSARLDVTGEIQIASTGATAAAVGAGGLRWDGTNIQYSNGAAWVNMLNGNTGWQLAGNAGTGAELLGTTNAQPLRVITNNTERMRVDAAGNIGIGSAAAAPGQLLHIQSAGAGSDLINSGISLGRTAGSDYAIQITNPAGGLPHIDMANAAGEDFDVRIGLSGNDALNIEGGNLGLGFAAPAYRIDIANAATGGIRIQDNGFAGFPNGYQYLTIGDDAYFSDVDVANTTALYGLANPDRAGLYFGSSGALIFGIAGNFGIGNNTPSARLDVTGEIQIASTGATAAAIGAGGLRWDGTNIQFSNGAVWSNLGSGWGLTGNAGTVAGTNFIGTTDNVRFDVRTNNANRMTVSNTGLVGIGTVAPANNLDLQANAGVEPQMRIFNPVAANGNIAGMRLSTASGWNVQLRTRQDNSWLELTDGGGGIAHRWNGNNYHPGNSTAYLTTGAGTANVLLANGQMQVTQLGGQAVVRNHNIYTNGNGNQDFGNGGGYNMFSSEDNNWEASGIYNDGNISAWWNPGDGTQVWSFLDEDSWGDANGNPYDGGATRAYINAVGQYFQVSDRNKKTNIQPLQNALGIIEQIGGYSYEFTRNEAEIAKGQTNIPAVGVMAQEVRAVYPLAVDVNESGEHFVNYDALVPLLIEAMKQQQEQIRTLQQRVQVLEANR